MAGGHEHHEHHETFISKYIFSFDHKMIAKQYLITAIIMAVFGMGMSVLFRLQLAWPGEKMAILNFFLICI
jgi:cytochrome c oxidase subunit 1